jgi:hypothetical protein
MIESSYVGHYNNVQRLPYHYRQYLIVYTVITCNIGNDRHHQVLRNCHKVHVPGLRNCVTLVHSILRTAASEVVVVVGGPLQGKQFPIPSTISPFTCGF